MICLEHENLDSFKDLENSDYDEYICGSHTKSKKLLVKSRRFLHPRCVVFSMRILVALLYAFAFASRLELVSIG